MLNHMRTTFLIDDDLYTAVKQIAVTRRSTTTSVVEEALRQLVAAQQSAQGEAQPPRRFHTISSPLVDPNLDITNAVEVEDYLDDVDPGHALAGVRDHAYA